MDPRSHSNHQKLFQISGMPHLVSDLISDHYRSLHCFFIFKNNMWVSYLPCEVVESTLDAGVELFGNQEAFEEYKKGFTKYKKEAKDFFESALRKEMVTQDDVTRFTQYLANYAIHYSKTEFFFTDRAFEQSTDDEVLKQNLEELGKIKNESREFINASFFGSQSYLSHLIRLLAKQFSVSEEDLFAYNRKELADLFDNKQVPQGELQFRRIAYVMRGDGDSFFVVSGNEALELIQSFNKDTDAGKLIKGKCANPGKVQGYAKKISTGYDTFDQIHKEIEAMEIGQILVSDTTSPELMNACKKAAAIVTNQGGLLSHAAIVSREFNIPCIVGTGNATELLQDGDFVEVDADNGVVRILK